jgi:hypothetical protein
MSEATTPRKPTVRGFQGRRPSSPIANSACSPKGKGVWGINDGCQEGSVPVQSLLLFLYHPATAKAS